MVTDRPDQSEATAVVGRGVFRLETGFDFERDESPGVVEENTELASAPCCAGAFRTSVELRFAFSAYTREQDRSCRTANSSPRGSAIPSSA